MKRRRVLIIAAVVFVVAVVAVVVWPVQKEPEYQGRRLSEWLQIYETGGDITKGTFVYRAWEDARQGVLHIGKRATPFLLARVGYERSASQSRLLEVCIRFPRVPGAQRYISYLVDKRGPSYIEAGSGGFDILGPIALDAVPQLEKWASDPAKPARAVRAQNALRAIGTNALPAFVRVASNPAAPDRTGVLALISRFQRDARQVGPELARLVCDPDSDVAWTAAWMLGDLQVDAKVAVPALTRALHDSRHDVRMSAAWSLGEFGESARPAVPMLIDACGDSDERVRMAATNSLLAIAPEVLTNRVTQVHE